MVVPRAPATTLDEWIERQTDVLEGERVEVADVTGAGKLNDSPREGGSS